MIRLSNFTGNLRGDVLGGVTAGIVALPLALAFGEQTELGAIAGLYGAIALGIFAALFGGTPSQISGPTGPMTVVSAVIIAEAIQLNGNLQSAFPMIIATFVLAGILEAVLGFFKLGSYIKYMPYPVVSGFMSGIGCIIIITQIFPLLGVDAPAGGPMGTIKSIHKIPEIVNIYSIGIAIATIIIIYTARWVTKKIPGNLIALLIVTVVAYFFIPEENILRLNTSGPLPSGLPKLHLNFWSVYTDFSKLTKIFEYALTLAFLGAIDSLLTSIVADNLTKTRHHSNQELIGQGIGNTLAGFIGGLPGAGATMRTVINIRSGAKTRLSGLVAGIFLVLVLLGIGPVVGHIPNAVLAGILITVGISIIDYKGLKHLNTVPRSDAVILILVLLVTVFVDLLVAVAAGLILAAILFMKKIADVVEDRVEVAPLKDFSREIPWLDEGDIISRIGEKVYIKHLNGPLFFGFANRFKEMVQALPKIQLVVLRMDKVPYIDQSGLYALEEAIIDLEEKNIEVLFTGLHGQPRDMIEKIKIIPQYVESHHDFETFDECARWIEKNIH